MDEVAAQRKKRAMRSAGVPVRKKKDRGQPEYHHAPFCKVDPCCCGGKWLLIP